MRGRSPRRTSRCSRACARRGWISASCWCRSRASSILAKPAGRRATPGLFLALAARVNSARDLASEDAGAHAPAVDYLRSCVDVARGVRRADRRRAALRRAAGVRRPRARADRARRHARRRVARVVAGLRTAGGLAAEQGVAPRGRAAQPLRDRFLQYRRQAVELVERVGSARPSASCSTRST